MQPRDCLDWSQWQRLWPGAPRPDIQSKFLLRHRGYSFSTSRADVKSHVVVCKYCNRSVIRALRSIYLTSPLGSAWGGKVTVMLSAIQLLRR
jgi:hypothetical protein